MAGARRRRSREAVDWLRLPKKILEVIISRIKDPGDLFRFGSVCKSWHAAVLDMRRRIGHSSSLQLSPMLHAHVLESRKADRTVHRFYVLSKKKKAGPYSLELREAFSRNYNYRFHNSTQGWLVMTNKSGHISLVNPLFSKLKIRLPKGDFSDVSDFRHPYGEGFLKVIASASPLNPDCVFMSISSCQPPAICRPDDETWHKLANITDRNAFRDILYFKNEFYIMTRRGDLLLCQGSPVMKATRVASGPVVARSGSRRLIEACGDLLQLVELDPVLRKRRGMFEMFKLNFSSWEWSKVTSLKDYDTCLMLTPSSAMSMPAAVAAEFPELKQKCAYFNQRGTLLDCDLGPGWPGTIYNVWQIFHSDSRWFMPDTSLPSGV